MSFRITAGLVWQYLVVLAPGPVSPQLCSAALLKGSDVTCQICVTLQVLWSLFYFLFCSAKVHLFFPIDLIETKVVFHRTEADPGSKNSNEDVEVVG